MTDGRASARFEVAAEGIADQLRARTALPVGTFPESLPQLWIETDGLHYRWR